jgi:phosphoglycolate phosphatase-like HAD superfamily hydrolase
VRFAALLFDLDGTLVDSHHEICLALARALADLGVALPFHNIERMVDGSPLEVVWERVQALEPLSADYGLFATSYREHYMRDIGHATSLFPGVVETLTMLRTAHPTLHFAVVSNKSAQSVRPLLEKLHIPPKPDPHLLLQAARELACEPGRCAMVGDTPFDVLAGKRAGMTTIAISHGMAEAHELAHAGADHLIHAFSELGQLLLR